MRKLIFLLIFIFIDLFSQPIFIKKVGTGQDEIPFYVLEEDNNFLLLGWFAYLGTYYSYILLSFDETGSFYSKKIFIPQIDGKAARIIKASDGGYYMTGWYQSSLGPYGTALLKLDENLNITMSKYFLDTSRKWFLPISILESQGGGVFIIGVTRRSDVDYMEMFIMKLDANGTMDWHRLLKYDKDVYVTDATFDNAGNIIITGGIVVGRQNFIIPFLMSVDTSGNILWVKKVPLGTYSYGTRLYIEENDIYLLGNTDGFTNGLSVFLSKWDNTGNLVWIKGYGRQNNDMWSYHFVKDGGNFLISSQYQSRVALLKITQNGEILWFRQFDDYPPHYPGVPVVSTRDGYICMPSISVPQRRDDIFIMKFDKEGYTCSFYYSEPTLTTSDITVPVFDISFQEDFSNVGPSSSSFTSSFFYPDEIYDCRSFVFTTDDSLSLAYNGGRKLVFDENNEIIHLVFTDGGYVYYSSSSDLGYTWETPYSIGPGGFPVIVLDSDGNPCIAWTNDKFLNFAKKTQQGWEIHKFTFPYIIGSLTPEHPSMTISTFNNAIDTVHILVRLYIPANGPMNYIREISFPIDDPSQRKERLLEFSGYRYMKKLDFPSITYSKQRGTTPPMLHAVWQHGDTIYYATREIGNPNWNVWGWQFDSSGINSSHPFIETYGDKVYVVWSHKEGINQLEEVYRGQRFAHPDVNYYSFEWTNLSQTPLNYRSLYPVNAGGAYGVYVEDLWPEINGSKSDIFWRVSPDELPHRVTHDFSINSRFPHAFNYADVLGIVWLEGNEPPYSIQYRNFIVLLSEIPYYTSLAGYRTPSLYLVSRDTFFTQWNIPVDAGYVYVKYEFPLEPGYRYKVKAILYHERAGTYRAKLKIDGRRAIPVKYSAFKPETLDFWIKPQYYEDDGRVELVFENKKGDFVCVGPIYVYRFTEKGKEELFSGIQTVKTEYPGIHHLLPTFVKNEKIEFSSFPFKNTEIEVFDVSGRKVLRSLSRGKKILPFNFGAGVYFVILKNAETGEKIKRKLIKLR